MYSLTRIGIYNFHIFTLISDRFVMILRLNCSPVCVQCTWKFRVKTSFSDCCSTLQWRSGVFQNRVYLLFYCMLITFHSFTLCNLKVCFRVFATPQKYNRYWKKTWKKSPLFFSCFSWKERKRKKTKRAILRRKTRAINQFYGNKSQPKIENRLHLPR